MSAGATPLLVGLLGVAVIIALIAQRARVPSAVALVAFGAATAAVHPIDLPFDFGNTLLFVFLPPLIFEASWNIDLRALRRVAWRVAFLAVPGVVLVAGIIGAAISLSGQLPLAPALLLGAIVAATDPVAVIAIFRRLRVPPDLQMLIEGESIANDGVAIVLYGIALAFASAVRPAAPNVAIAHGFVAIAGGCAIGLALAAVVAFALGATDDGPIEVTGTVVLAFLAYVAADALALSGVFATAAAGIGLRAMQRHSAVTRNAQDVDSFWAAVAFIANALVFLVTGLTVQVGRIGHEPRLVFVVLAAVIVSRALLAVLVTRTFAWRATVVLAGMRGGLSLALALALPADLAHRAEIIDAVFAVVLFTLVVQGVSLEPVLRRLRFHNGSGGPSLSS